MTAGSLNAQSAPFTVALASALVAAALGLLVAAALDIPMLAMSRPPACHAPMFLVFAACAGVLAMKGHRRVAWGPYRSPWRSSTLGLPGPRLVGATSSAARTFAVVALRKNLQMSAFAANGNLRDYDRAANSASCVDLPERNACQYGPSCTDRAGPIAVAISASNESVQDRCVVGL